MPTRSNRNAVYLRARGQERLLRQIRSLKGAKKVLDRRTAVLATALANDIRANTPVKSGRLRDSTAVRRARDGSIRVGWFTNPPGGKPPNRDQAVAIEFNGHSSKAPNGVIRPALARQEAQIENVAKEINSKVIRRAGSR